MNFRERVEQRRRESEAREAKLWEQAHSAARALRELGVGKGLVFGSLAKGKVVPESDLDRP